MKMQALFLGALGAVVTAGIIWVVTNPPIGPGEPATPIPEQLPPTQPSQTTAPVARVENGCETGAVAIANAYIRWNAIYALYFGDLESYVASNRVHFGIGGDAIRCAEALASAILARSIQTYDPRVASERQLLDARLRAAGVTPGGHPPTASEMLFETGTLLSHLARTLPAASAGDYRPMQSPVDEVMRMREFARQILQTFLSDPIWSLAFQSLEPDIRSLANAEYRMLLAWASELR